MPPAALPPPLPAAAPAACDRCLRAPPCPPPAAAEPRQQQEQPKLSKLQKRRVKEDLERRIRAAEMKKLEVGAGAGGRQQRKSTWGWME